MFAEQEDLIKILARDLRKRIVVRPTILEDPERAATAIREVVGENAGISDIFFEADSGEVLIEAEKPGVVIGKNGTTLRDITREIGWTPQGSKNTTDREQYCKTGKTVFKSCTSGEKGTIKGRSEEESIVMY